MALVINNNTMATNAQNNLTKHYGALATSTERLSSGLRINKAADDAAGLAIRELMRAEIAAYGQGIRNSNDAISMIQTADGALGVIDEKLVRMKELAEQAATGTYNSVQRLMIESEYQAMASEITRISEATDFNGVYLLNGSLSGDHNGRGQFALDNDGEETDVWDISSTGAVRVHFGTANSSAEDYYDIVIKSSTASSLGLGAIDGRSMSDDELLEAMDVAGRTISTQSAAQLALEAITNAIISKDNIRADLGAMQNRLETTVDNLTIQKENLQASESRISDTDIASEMTNFVKNQILTNAAVSMLGQANSLPQMALQLIG